MYYAKIDTEYAILIFMVWKHHNHNYVGMKSLQMG